MAKPKKNFIQYILKNVLVSFVFFYLFYSLSCQSYTQIWIERETEDAKMKMKIMKKEKSGKKI